jgi:hypothetical protein
MTHLLKLLALQYVTYCSTLIFFFFKRRVKAPIYLNTQTDGLSKISFKMMKSQRPFLRYVRGYYGNEKQSKYI